MKLEVGRTYRARNGELWKVVNKYTSSRYPFIAMTLDESEENCYTEDGQSLIDVNSLRDLVIEVDLAIKEQQTTNLNLVEAYRAVKTGEWECKHPDWDEWKDASYLQLWSSILLTRERDDFEIRRIQKPLVIEAGKYYRTRGGDKAYVGWIMPDDFDYAFPVQGLLTGDLEEWQFDGSLCEDDTSDRDLVALWENE